MRRVPCLHPNAVTRAVREALAPSPAPTDTSKPRAGGQAAVQLNSEEWDAWIGAGLVPQRTTEMVIVMSYLLCPAKPGGQSDRSATLLRSFAVSGDGRWEIELNESATATVVRALRSARPDERPPSRVDHAGLIRAEKARIDVMAAGGPLKLKKAVFAIAAIAVRPA